MLNLKHGLSALCVSLLAAPVLAQAGPPGAAPPAPPNPDAIMADLSNVAQITAAAKKCNWTDPLYVLASESMLAIKAADLKAMVAPEMHGQVDARLAASAASVSTFACKQPDGKDQPQQHDITMFVMDQYWRMIAHVDVLGSLRWGENVFRYTPDERKALDKEIAHIQEFKGYSYNQVANPLETLADKTEGLACRERPADGKRCRPVPAELEGAAPTVKVMIETTEAFGKAVAAEKLKEKKAFADAVGDIRAFSVIGNNACTPDALVVKTADAHTKSETSNDSFGEMTREVMFAEKFRLGKPDSVGWVLLFRSIMAGSGGNYIILAENGGEWDEESARIGAGNVDDLYAAQVALIETLPAAERPKAIQEAKESISSTYFMNFTSMGLMQSINGDAGISLTPCTLD